MARNPFVMSVCRGDAPRAAIRAYAEQLAVLADMFPSMLSSLMSMCDEPVIRRALINNLLEEEGAVGYGAHGVVFDPERRHGAVARRMTSALRSWPPDDELRRTSEHASFIDRCLAERRWVSAVSFLTVGYEANVPPTFALLAPALASHYGLDDAALEFMILHIGADERHAETGAAMMESIATTAERRAQALEGAVAGARAWWALHTRFARRSANVLAR
jgi:pyrroloquinoline quinone (PQQ) biosynthesis protein C